EAVVPMQGDPVSGDDRAEMSRCWVRILEPLVRYALELHVADECQCGQRKSPPDLRGGHSLLTQHSQESPRQNGVVEDLLGQPNGRRCRCPRRVTACSR